MNRSLRRLVWAALMPIVMALSCKPAYNGAVAADVDPTGWQAADTVELHFSPADTLTEREIWVVARAEADHIPTRIELQVECIAPDSTHLAGSVALHPTERKGGSFCQLRDLWIERAVFGQTGDYTFRLCHTSSEPLTDIWNVAIEVE